MIITNNLYFFNNTFELHPRSNFDSMIMKLKPDLLKSVAQILFQNNNKSYPQFSQKTIVFVN